jgi:hypothetical protein
MKHKKTRSIDVLVKKSDIEKKKKRDEKINGKRKIKRIIKENKNK